MEAFNVLKAFQQAARIYEARLRFQSPVSGKLKSSIRVTVVETSDSYQMVSNFESYGVFTDSGTKTYFDPSDTKPWVKNPGRGRGGIKPRYWTNVSDATTKSRITKIIQKALADATKSQLKSK